MALNTERRRRQGATRKTDKGKKVSPGARIPLEQHRDVLHVERAGRNAPVRTLPAEATKSEL